MKPKPDVEVHGGKRVKVTRCVTHHACDCILQDALRWRELVENLTEQGVCRLYEQAQVLRLEGYGTKRVTARSGL